MGALGLLQAVVNTVSALTNWLHERQLIDLATKAALSAKLQEITDALDKAHDARGGAELDADLHPERLRDDDGFKRD